MLKMKELDDLEWLSSGSVGTPESDQTAYHDILEFAEKYFNVHYTHTASNATISKFNVVRRRSLTVCTIHGHQQI